MKPQSKNPLPAGPDETARVIPLHTGTDEASTAKAETLVITDLLTDLISGTAPELKDYLTTLIQQGQFTAPQQKYLKVTSRDRMLAPRVSLAQTICRCAVDPEIRIVGRWIWELGFRTGEYAKVISFYGMIIIFPQDKPQQAPIKSIPHVRTQE